MLTRDEQHKLLRELIPILRAERVRLENRLQAAGYQSITGEELEYEFRPKQEGENKKEIKKIRTGVINQVMAHRTPSSINGRKKLEGYTGKEILVLDLTECHPSTSPFLIPETNSKNYQDNPEVYELRTHPVSLEHFFSESPKVEAAVSHQARRMGFDGVKGSSHLHYSVKKNGIAVNDPAHPDYLSYTGRMMEGQARALYDFFGCITSNTQFLPMGADFDRANVLRLCKDNVELRRTQRKTNYIENEIQIISLLVGAVAGLLHERGERANWGVAPYDTTLKINFDKQQGGPDLTCTKRILGNAHVNNDGRLNVSRSYLFGCLSGRHGFSESMYLNELGQIFRGINFTGGKPDILLLTNTLKKMMDNLVVVRQGERNVLAVFRGDLRQENYDFICNVAANINNYIPIKNVSRAPYVPPVYQFVPDSEGGTSAQHVARFEKSGLYKSILSPEAFEAILNTLKKMYGLPTYVDQHRVNQNEAELRRNHIPDITPQIG